MVQSRSDRLSDPKFQRGIISDNLRTPLKLVVKFWLPAAKTNQYLIYKHGAGATMMMCGRARRSASCGKVGAFSLRLKMKRPGRKVDGLNLEDWRFGNTALGVRDSEFDVPRPSLRQAQGRLWP
jgi:hypothetical protein